MTAHLPTAPMGYAVHGLEGSNHSPRRARQSYDPRPQRRCFNTEAEAKKSYDQEAEDDHGPPPAVQVELGIDRNFSYNARGCLPIVFHFLLPPTAHQRPAILSIPARAEAALSCLCERPTAHLPSHHREGGLKLQTRTIPSELALASSQAFCAKVTNFDDVTGTATRLPDLSSVFVFQTSTPASSEALARREESREKRRAFTAPVELLKTARGKGFSVWSQR